METKYLSNTDYLVSNLGIGKENLNIYSQMYIDVNTNELVSIKHTVVLTSLDRSRREEIFVGKTYKEAYDFIPNYVRIHYHNTNIITYHYLVREVEYHKPYIASFWNKLFDGYSTASEATNAGNEVMANNNYNNAEVIVRYYIIPI
jgi:hypothetical protein